VKPIIKIISSAKGKPGVTFPFYFVSSDNTLLVSSNLITLVKSP